MALFRRVPAAHQLLGALIVVGAGVAVSALASRRTPEAPA